MAPAEPGAFLVVRIVVEPEFDEEFNRWYDEEHFPERMAVPGFLSGRRMVSREPGRTTYLAYYELTGPEVLTSPEYLAIGDPAKHSPWTQRVVAHLIENDRRVYESVSFATSRSADEQ